MQQSASIAPASYHTLNFKQIRRTSGIFAQIPKGILRLIPFLTEFRNKGKANPANNDLCIFIQNYSQKLLSKYLMAGIVNCYFVFLLQYSCW